MRSHWTNHCTAYLFIIFAVLSTSVRPIISQLTNFSVCDDEILFTLVLDLQTFAGAETACVTNGFGTLARIDNNSTFAAVQGLKVAAGTTVNFWVGVSDPGLGGVNAKRFTFIDGVETELVFVQVNNQGDFPWASGQPDDGGLLILVDENCVEWQAIADRWNDQSCTDRRNYVCRSACPNPTASPTLSPTLASPQTLPFRNVIGVPIFAGIVGVLAVLLVIMLLFLHRERVKLKELKIFVRDGFEEFPTVSKSSRSKFELNITRLESSPGKKGKAKMIAEREVSNQPIHGTESISENLI